MVGHRRCSHVRFCPRALGPDGDERRATPLPQMRDERWWSIASARRPVRRCVRLRVRPPMWCACRCPDLRRSSAPCAATGAARPTPSPISTGPRRARATTARFFGGASAAAQKSPSGTRGAVSLPGPRRASSLSAEPHARGTFLGVAAGAGYRSEPPLLISRHGSATRPSSADRRWTLPGRAVGSALARQRRSRRRARAWWQAHPRRPRSVRAAVRPQ